MMYLMEDIGYNTSFEDKSCICELHADYIYPLK